MDPTLDLQSLWLAQRGAASPRPALADPWGPAHRPDWAARGLIIWPRGGQWLHLRLRLTCGDSWRALGSGRAVARLCLRWWADAMELLVDAQPVHGGDLFDTACRWPLPERWWAGEPLELELRLRSPCHDDGALIHSRLELEPLDPTDPDGLLAPSLEALASLRRQRGRPEGTPSGFVQVLGHAHLDLAWLWPVADTWRAAERTFVSALDLMERFPQLHFGHSTPALYAWLELQRPALFARIRSAMRAGRWEPLNGPWVESDCVLLDTASLLRQFQEGQHYSQRSFPEWTHNLAWLPDSFGFAAGLPAVAAATGVSWFCTHKLAWNATNPFPHRLFRWRSRCGSEVLALMTAPIGTDGDPLPIETYRLDWQRATGVGEALWLPGVGDHGGGPTAEMLEQLALWQQQPAAVPQRHGTLRAYLERLEPLAPQLPVWRDELYLELHRGCATSRPDQKRHNRTLERLLREAELARALLLAVGGGMAVGRPGAAAGAESEAAIDWRPLLFQQFHDILPGTSIPEVFEQAEPQWRAARRRSRAQRDRDLQALLAGAEPAAAAQGDGEAQPAAPPPAAPLPAPPLPAPAPPAPSLPDTPLPATALPESGSLPRPPAARSWTDIPLAGTALACQGTGGDAASDQARDQLWWLAQLQALPATARTVRLPAGDWSLLQADGLEQALPAQAAAEGGVWIQLPVPAGVAVLALRRRRAGMTWAPARGLAAPPSTLLGPGRSSAEPLQPSPAALPSHAERPPLAAQQPLKAPLLPLQLQEQPPLQPLLPLNPSTSTPAPPCQQPSPPWSAQLASLQVPLKPQTPQPPPARQQPWPLRPELQPVQPVQFVPAVELGPDHWRLGNGLIEAVIGPAGLEQLVAGSGAGLGESLLAAPLRWQRWADRGEFWDAWDLAADHRRHPLPWDWHGPAEVISAGPLAVQLRWRGRVGASPVRLELRLLAGSPWLDLVLCQHWRQRHELLQLEIPLARKADRWAADTSAGVMERPAEAYTPREQARWEVPAISWVAAAGLAVLLDGPQGVSAAAERLSVSLLRAPTWPDPGADNGWQRQRLGLMAAPAGWRPARVPQQARRLREPLWLRPRQTAEPSAAAALQAEASPLAGRGWRWPALPPLDDDLRLVGLRPASAIAPAPGSAAAPESVTESVSTAASRPPASVLGTEAYGLDQPFADQPGGVELVLSIQNEGPCRRRLELGPAWQVLERLDGLDRPWAGAGDSLVLRPWQLAFWRIRWRSSAPG